MTPTHTSRQSEVTLRVHQHDAQEVGVAAALARASREAAMPPIPADLDPADLPAPTPVECVADGVSLLLRNLAEGRLEQASDDAGFLARRLAELAQSSAHERMQLAALISGSGQKVAR